MTQTEKGFRVALCGNCNKKIQFRIDEVMYGTKVRVRCPNCKNVATVEIPRPPTEKQTPRATASGSRPRPNVFDPSFDFDKFFDEFFSGGQKHRPL